MLVFGKAIIGILTCSLRSSISLNELRKLRNSNGPDANFLFHSYKFYNYSSVFVVKYFVAKYFITWYVIANRTLPNNGQHVMSNCHSNRKSSSNCFLLGKKGVTRHILLFEVALFNFPRSLCVGP